MASDRRENKERGKLPKQIQSHSPPCPSQSCSGAGRTAFTISYICYTLPSSLHFLLPSGYFGWLEFPIKAATLVAKGDDMINAILWGRW